MLEKWFKSSALALMLMFVQCTRLRFVHWTHQHQRACTGFESFLSQQDLRIYWPIIEIFSKLAIKSPGITLRWLLASFWCLQQNASTTIKVTYQRICACINFAMRQSSIFYNTQRTWQPSWWRQDVWCFIMTDAEVSVVEIENSLWKV